MTALPPGRVWKGETQDGMERMEARAANAPRNGGVVEANANRRRLPRGLPRRGVGRWRQADGRAPQREPKVEEDGKRVPGHARLPEDGKDVRVEMGLRHRRQTLEGDKLPRMAAPVESPADVEEDAKRIAPASGATKREEAVRPGARQVEPGTDRRQELRIGFLVATDGGLGWAPPTVSVITRPQTGLDPDGVDPNATMDRISVYIGDKSEKTQSQDRK